MATAGGAGAGAGAATAVAESFNTEYQRILDNISDRVILKEYRQFRDLSRLARDFASCAIQYGKIIISGAGWVPRTSGWLQLSPSHTSVMSVMKMKQKSLYQ